MSYPYEAHLRAKANMLVDALHTASLPANIIEDSFREYHVKVAVPGGNVLLYHKPSKNEFSLRYHELKNKKAVPQIKSAWQKIEKQPITAILQSLPPVPVKPQKDVDYQQSPDEVETWLQLPEDPEDKRQSPEEGIAYIQKMAKTTHQAFVDGSYDHGTVGYGAVIFEDYTPTCYLFGCVSQHTESHQIGGELSATIRVLEWCDKQNIREIDIFYDYVGIEKWARGIWRAKSPVAQAYVRYMRKNFVRVYWHRVESHSGNYWNEVADQLAKRGTSS